jgi:serine/threonine-protein kinase HipA
MTEQDAQIAAHIELHRGLERQGPGDAAFSRRILAELPHRPADPRIADLGCGAGAGALLLAESFGVPVRAVDMSREFLDELEARAQRRGLAHLVEPIEADIGRLDWPAGSIDLLWSEGAAYNLGFATALRRWRPLLAPGGVAVISELSWFGDDIPAPARTYWAQAYPEIGSEADNIAHARAQGFEVLGVRRLPAAAWWNNYYGPLQARIEALRGQADAAMQAVIRETEAEMALFREHSDVYGYAFYLLRARD